MKMRHFLKIAFLTPALAISLSLAGLAQSSGPAPGRPGLYEFGSNYCAACKQMKEVIAALKASHGDQVGAPWVILAGTFTGLIESFLQSRGAKFGTLMQQGAGVLIFFVGAYVFFQGVRAW